MIHINPQWPASLFKFNPGMDIRGMLAQCKVLKYEDWEKKRIVHYIDGCGDLVIETFEKSKEKIDEYIRKLVKFGVCGEDGNIYTVKTMNIDDAWNVLRTAAVYRNKVAAIKAMAVINNN